MTARRRRGTQRALRVLISAGPTREPIDPVRFLSNYSTGYMGAQLAAEALARGHRVTVVCGPGVEPMPPGARVLPVEQAAEMEQVLRRNAGRADLIIMAAAVSDFRAARVAAAKLPRQPQSLIRLRATPDIIARLPRRPRQLRVGFALESGRVVPRAQRKLRRKHLDLLLAQRVNGHGAPFGRARVRAWLLSRPTSPTAHGGRGQGSLVADLGTLSKRQVARVLLDKLEALWYGQPRLANTRCA